MRAEFDDSLVTGNEMIDGQHKELIDKINKLLDSCETSKDKLVAVKTLSLIHISVRLMGRLIERLEPIIRRSLPGTKPFERLGGGILAELCIRDSLETVAEAVASMKKWNLQEEEVVQLNVSRARRVGAYHLMEGQNPIYIISMTGGGGTWEESQDS